MINLYKAVNKEVHHNVKMSVTCHQILLDFLKLLFLNSNHNEKHILSESI